MSLEGFVTFLEESAVVQTHVPRDENDEPLQVVIVVVIVVVIFINFLILFSCCCIFVTIDVYIFL